MLLQYLGYGLPSCNPRTARKVRRRQVAYAENVASRIMYVKPGCPWCDQARDGLRAEGLDWEERDATSRSDWREELFTHSPSGKVPTIVAPDGVTIGWLGGG